MTLTPGEDEGSSHQEDELAPQSAGSTPSEHSATAGGGIWRSNPSDDDVDAAFAAIVSGIVNDAAWRPPTDSGTQAGAVERHPSAGGPTTESGVERARRREMRRLERAEEVAAFAAHEAEVEAERAADEAHFTPPEPPPLPRPKGRTIGAVLMILGGILLLARPGLLAVAADLTLVFAVMLILGGAILLLGGIWRRHSARDADGDDGAIV